MTETDDKPLRLADQQESMSAIVGLIGWVVAMAVLAIFFRHDLQRHHATWWFEAGGYGLVLGLYGLRFARRRRSR